MTLAHRLKNLAPSGKSSIAFCPKCFVQYHNTYSTPLLLPSCGHTVCYPCIQSLKKLERVLACPVCKIEVTADVESLPINYALLDLLEKSVRKCEKHDLEFAGYCKDHADLLCGACILEHRSCDLSYLNESELSQVIKSTKNSLIQKHNFLKSCKQSWVDGKQSFLSIVSKIEQKIESNQLNFTSSNQEVVKLIETAAEKIKQELDERYRVEAKKVKENLNKRILDNFRELKKVQNDFLWFDTMGLSQKLAVDVDEASIEEVDFKAVQSICDAIRVEVNYEEELKKKTLKFMYNIFSHSDLINSVYKKLGIGPKTKKVFLSGELKFARRPFVSLVPSRVKIMRPNTKKMTPMEIINKFHKKRLTMPAMVKELRDVDILEPIKGQIFGLEMESKVLNEEFGKAIHKMRNSVILTTGDAHGRNRMRVSKSLIGKRLAF